MFGRAFRIMLLWGGVGQAIWGFAWSSQLLIWIGILVAAIGLLALAKGKGESKRFSSR